MCVYERNVVTNDVLDRAGIELCVVPSEELSRGRGGPRCMSMPFAPRRHLGARFGTVRPWPASVPVPVGAVSRPIPASLPARPLAVSATVPHFPHLRKGDPMPLNLSGKHFLTLLDFSPEEIRYLLDLSRDFKNMKRAGVPHRYLEGKNIVLLFEKTSTRTRCAFEVGAMDLGMGVTYLDPGSSQMGKKESIEDTARVLGRMYDGIEYRGFEQSVVEDLAENAGVPVWNGLTAQFHPTQALADVLTMQEEFGPDLRGRKLAFFGQVGNTASSLLVICAKLGIDFVQVGPQADVPGKPHLSSGAVGGLPEARGHKRGDALGDR